jgi:zinc protease
VEIMVAPVHRLPIVSVRVLIDAGASNEAIGAAGVARLTARGMAEGTQRVDGASLAEAFERLGGSLAIDASWDATSLATTVLRDRFPSVLRLLGEVVREPAFPDREILRLRDERLAELLELRAEPRGLANLVFESLVYDRGSRFALPEAGSSSTVRTLTRQSVLDFYEERYAPGVTTVVVAGDITVEEAMAQAEIVFGQWSGTPRAPLAVETTPATDQRTIHLICRPDAPQSELRLGHVGIPRSHRDYFGAVVMNAILGGVFNSRINLNLRERNGYTYGASSAFDWRRASGPWVVSTAVATEATASAIREIMNELDRIREAPPNADELSLVVSYLEGVFPIRFETTEAIASALSALKVFGLRDDYYDSYRSKIRSVAASDVQLAAEHHVHPERLQIVAVGDPNRVSSELEALGLGSLQLRDLDGELIPQPAV